MALGLTLPQGSVPGSINATARQRQRDEELEEAIRLGRWVGEEERALLEAEAAAEREARRQAERLQVRRRGLLVMACLAIVVPVLWPLVVIGAIVLFPRTSRRLLIAAGALAAALLLALGLLVGQLLHRFAPPMAPPVSPAEQPIAPPSGSGGAPSSP